MSEDKQVEEVASANGSVETMVEAEANAVEPKDQVKEQQPEPPPNGGWFAWLQVAGSFFLFFNCWYVSKTVMIFPIGHLTQ